MSSNRFIARASTSEALKSASVVSIADLKALFPEAGKETHGEQISWSVAERRAGLTVSFEYTFRRSTRTAAFKSNSSRISAANARLKAVSEKFKLSLVSLKLCTLEEVKRIDEFAENNGDRAYSEYEQSIGGEVVFKASLAY